VRVATEGHPYIYAGGTKYPYPLENRVRVATEGHPYIYAGGTKYLYLKCRGGPPWPPAA